MVNIVKIATNVVPKWTKNGCRLLSKQKLDFSSLPKNLIPERAVVLEGVEVETAFGKGLSKVYSFLDNEGKLLKKVVIKKKEGENTVKFIRNYERDGQVLFTDTKHILDGKVTGGVRESFFVKPIQNDVKGMSRMKLEYKLNPDGTRNETQIYENLAPKGYTLENKTLTTTATRLKDGRVINKTINGNSELISQVKEDPYLFIRNYSNEDFVESASLYAQQLQDVVGMKGQLRFKKLKKCGGYYEKGTKNVTIDLRHDKVDLVNTLNHEYRHKWQYKIISKYVKRFFNFFRKDNKIVLQESEQELAPRMLKSDILYCPSQVNYKKYYSNFLEQDARAAGAEAKNEFNKYSKKLAQLLGIPKEMTFCSTLNDKLSSFIQNHLQTTDVKVINMSELFAAAKS